MTSELLPSDLKVHSTIFDEVLGLEERFYDNGFHQGTIDGIKAGRVEGRTFGLEKGFEKFVESGRLHGKSLIWANRLPQSRKQDLKGGTSKSHEASQPMYRHHGPGNFSSKILPPLPDNPRLHKHITILHALAESESLSTENTEIAVSEFDDRLKRAQAKAKIVEKLSGDLGRESNGKENTNMRLQSGVEDVGTGI